MTFAPTIGASAGIGLAIALACATVMASTPVLSSNDDLAFFTRKTQEFSDAGLHGDRATLDRDLAPDVAFANEDGSTPTKSEILDSAKPLPPGSDAALRPELKDIFFLPGQPLARRIFQRDAAGRITGYVSRSNGQDLWVARRS